MNGLAQELNKYNVLLLDIQWIYQCPDSGSRIGSNGNTADRELLSKISQD